MQCPLSTNQAQPAAHHPAGAPGGALQAQVSAGQLVLLEEHGQPKVDGLEARVGVIAQQQKVAWAAAQGKGAG